MLNDVPSAAPSLRDPSGDAALTYWAVSAKQSGVAAAPPGITEAPCWAVMNASDDITVMMSVVQEAGGRATSRSPSPIRVRERLAAQRG